MFTLAVPAWQIAARAVVIYLAVFFGLRVMGKRELGQMAVSDLVVILLIANSVQNAMVGPDVSLVGGLVAAFALLAVNRAVAFVRLRTPYLERLLEGSPTVLIQDGRFLEAQLRNEGLERSELEMVMREHGVESVDEVKLAVLETDGTISIVPRETNVIRTRRRVRQLKKH